MGVSLKSSSPKKVIVLAYFQDMLRNLGHDLVLSGHGLDISGVPNYECREVGQSGINPHLCDSYRLHGKIAFPEIDYRLFTTMYRSYKGNQLFETPRKSISVLQREFNEKCAPAKEPRPRHGPGLVQSSDYRRCLGGYQECLSEVLDYDRSSSAVWLSS